VKKILTVIGARPQFIKASVISNAISNSDSLTEVMVHTGQHFDSNMSDIFFKQLGMPEPAYHLNIHSSSHGAMTGQMLMEIEKVLLDEAPDMLLVYGDTNSTLAGALAASKLHIPVAHIEAGLRSFNMRMPEEINRILTDRISRWLFTPTEAAVEHLKNEGFYDNQIIPVGDVMYDVALHHGARVEAHGGVLQRLDLTPKKYILATIHRAENTDDTNRLLAIVDAFSQASEKMPIVLPLHPRTLQKLNQLCRLDELSERLHLIDPIGYLDMVQLEKYAALIATDSGGVQKEAFFHKVPCVTLRDETEWMELVDAGWNKLVPPDDAKSIVAGIESSKGTQGENIMPYGDGDAAIKIIKILQETMN
jgi:UDP-GlcNAc3NAcA epimerase